MEKIEMNKNRKIACTHCFMMIEKHVKKGDE